MATRNEIAAALGELIVPREGGFVSAATVARLLRKYVGGQAWIMVEVDDVIRCIGGTPVTGDRHGWEGVGLKATEVGAQRLAVAKWEARLASEGMPAEVDKADTVDVVKSQLNRSYYDPLAARLPAAELEADVLRLVVNEGLSIRDTAKRLGIDRNRVDRVIARMRGKGAKPTPEERKPGTMSTAEAAKKLGVPARTVRYWAKHGRIASVRLGRLLRIVSPVRAIGAMPITESETSGQ